MTIKEFFDENRTCALAFSGGVDSAYLLYAGIQYGADVHAYYVKSEFQPQFELDDAKRLAGELHANMTIIEMSVLPYENVTENGPRRCYFCKQQIFSRIIRSRSSRFRRAPSSTTLETASTTSICATARLRGPS